MRSRNVAFIIFTSILLYSCTRSSTALFTITPGDETSAVIQNPNSQLLLPSENQPHESEMIEYTYQGEHRAPEIPAGLEWLNVDQPLTIHEDLKGKIVLLDFWTSGCVNCMHVIPELKRLEAEYPDSLVVIGIHSGKFQAEGEIESLRQAVVRYGIEHPVVNDKRFVVWRDYNARAWPSLFLIDPQGNAIGYHMGEGVYDVFQPIIDVMDKEYTASGVIDTAPLQLVLEKNAAPPTLLEYPGKVLADEEGQRLFIADSGHHRVLVTNLKGELQVVIGSGRPGYTDSAFPNAEFSKPQGMALSADGQTLYIADRDNHVIRAANLATHEVTTIAGTGKQARQYPSGEPALETDFSSPWDLYLHADKLYIASAGVHQLWVLDLTKNRVDVFAGNGGEGIDDGPPENATLAQPSGLASDGLALYFTDPESSAVRSVPLSGEGEVRTIIGIGLFDFGDEDGSYPDARLQHALGIAYYGSRLFVADTYNNKIKVIDPIKQTSETWLGNGAAGWQDGVLQEAQFAEPGGLSIAGNQLFVADTNNHLIRVVNLNTGVVQTLRLTNLELLAASQDAANEAQTLQLEPQTISNGDGELVLNFTLPEGYKFNELGTSTVTWHEDDDEEVISREFSNTYTAKTPEFPLRYPAKFSNGQTSLHITATLYYCKAAETEVCLIEEVSLEVPVRVDDNISKKDITIEYDLPALEH
ncbi:MAG: redoxin domain-containing protein [Anaerolineales bacterium]|nr:redoxin domain-containing protein [Anaerolineales bacterium]